MTSIFGWLVVVGLLLGAIILNQAMGAAASTAAMPPFLVTFLIAEALVAYVWTWRHALVLLIGAHLTVQFVFTPVPPILDVLGGNPTVLVRIASFAALGLTLIALISAQKRQLRQLSQAQGLLAASEDRFSAVFDQAPSPIWLFSVAGEVSYANQQARKFALPDTGAYNLLEDPDLAQTGIPVAARRALAGRLEVVRGVPYRQGSATPGGPKQSWRWVDVVLFPIKNVAGDVQQLVAIVNDVTRERELLGRLEQSQRLEAVGQLTGGVAHDFNNLLTIILGNLELAELDLEPNATALALIQEARGAGERGAKLTQKLLAFSRKQPLMPRVLDLRDLVRGIEDLLTRTLGEDIDIEVVSSAGLWRCEADHAQLENVVLNLAINARDAMPDGGRLTIETGNASLDDDYAAAHPGAEPGQYAMLAVSDTGSGMSADVVRKAFEPFFTTKGNGGGSGLGLSMAIGFVKQSGGYIEIYSEVGVGTTVKVYLPRTHADPAHRAVAEPTDEPQGAGETVLVVEDDGGVRRLAVAALARLGYAVLSAEGAGEALRLLGEDSAIDLLLTDVVLPGEHSGATLARQAQAQWPELKVLYMSGYTENAIIHDGRLDQGVELLQKPFTKLQLARKVHSTMRAGN